MQLRSVLAAGGVCVKWLQTGDASNRPNKAGWYLAPLLMLIVNTNKAGWYLAPLLMLIVNNHTNGSYY